MQEMLLMKLGLQIKRLKRRPSRRLKSEGRLEKMRRLGVHERKERNEEEKGIGTVEGIVTGIDIGVIIVGTITMTSYEDSRVSHSFKELQEVSVAHRLFHHPIDDCINEIEHIISRPRQAFFHTWTAHYNTNRCCSPESSNKLKM